MPPNIIYREPLKHKFIHTFIKHHEVIIEAFDRKYGRIVGVKYNYFWKIISPISNHRVYIKRVKI